MSKKIGESGKRGSTERNMEKKKRETKRPSSSSGDEEEEETENGPPEGRNRLTGLIH